jgi:hypothetical protein
VLVEQLILNQLKTSADLAKRGVKSRSINQLRQLLTKNENIMNKKLTKQIAKNLDQLSHLLDKIDEARIIQSTEPQTWDCDLLSNLLSNCQKVIKLLEDKKNRQEKDPWGEPLILEEGLCSLMNAYQNEEEENEEEEDD